MLTTISAWITGTLIGAILTWLASSVFVAAFSYVFKLFFNNVIVDGGFADFGKIETFVSDIVAIKGINLQDVIITISIVILALVIIGQGLKMVLSANSGKGVSSPYAFIMRCVISVIMILAYPTIVGWVCDLLNAFAKYKFFNFADIVNTGIDYDAMAEQITKIFGNGIIETVVLIVLMFMLTKKLILAVLIYLERYISFCLYMVLGPIAMAFYPDEEQQGMLTSWLTGIISQIIVILLSIFVFYLFANQISLLGSDSVLSSETTTLCQAVVAMVLLGLVEHSEQIVNMLGIRTMPSGQTARELAGAIYGAGSSALAVAGAAGGIYQTGKETAKNLQAAKLASDTSYAPAFVGSGVAGKPGMGPKMDKEQQVKLFKNALNDYCNRCVKKGIEPDKDAFMKRWVGTGNAILDAIRQTAIGRTAEQILLGAGAGDYNRFSQIYDEKMAELNKENKTLSTGSKAPSAQGVLNQLKAEGRYNGNATGVGNAREISKASLPAGLQKTDANGNGYKAYALGMKDEKGNVGIAKALLYGKYDENGNWVNASMPTDEASKQAVQDFNKQTSCTFKQNGNSNELGISELSQDHLDAMHKVATDVAAEGKDGNGTAFNMSNKEDAAQFNARCAEVASERGLDNATFQIKNDEEVGDGLTMISGNNSFSRSGDPSSEMNSMLDDCAFKADVVQQKFGLDDNGNITGSTSVYSNVPDKDGEEYSFFGKFNSGTGDFTMTQNGEYALERDGSIQNTYGDLATATLDTKYQEQARVEDAAVQFAEETVPQIEAIQQETGIDFGEEIANRSTSDGMQYYSPAEVEEISQKYQNAPERAEYFDNSEDSNVKDLTPEQMADIIAKEEAEQEFYAEHGYSSRSQEISEQLNKALDSLKELGNSDGAYKDYSYDDYEKMSEKINNGKFKPSLSPSDKLQNLSFKE